MRKKRLIAAVLVGTMVFSSVAYADVQEQGDATETQSVEQQLEEEQLEEQQLIAEYKVATPVNAAVKEEVPEEEEQQQENQFMAAVQENAAAQNPVQGQENPTSVTIHLTTDVFHKTYGKNDPVIYSIPASQYEIVGGDTSARKKNLSQISYKREAGEKPGRYKITEVSCEQYAELKLDEESSWFTVEKKSCPFCGIQDFFSLVCESDCTGLKASA